MPLFVVLQCTGNGICIISVPQETQDTVKLELEEGDGNLVREGRVEFTEANKRWHSVNQELGIIARSS